FDSGQLMLESAAEGLGVAFMLDFHLEGATDPRLVKLFDEEADSESSYWFVCRRAALSRRPVRLFHDRLGGGKEKAPHRRERAIPRKRQASAATFMLWILPGARGGSPFGSAST